MKTILVIDDEADLVSLLKDSLEDRGYKVLTAGDGASGVRQALERPDLVILDIMMPGIDGFAVCEQIRDAVPCPIIFLSAKSYETDRIRGLAVGGDDYIVKPFSLPELLAKIEAHLRREERAVLLNKTGKRTVLHDGNLTVDLQSRQVHIQGSSIALTRREFDIIAFLSLHPGQVFSKDQVYEKIWGYDAQGDANTVAEHVKNIRAKFAEADPAAAYISTVWGIGYKWEKQ